MLYDRWREIAQKFQKEIALRDLSSGRHWTFQQLSIASEAKIPSGDPIVFPQGISSDFILAVLRGWRSGKIICPVEIGQTAPTLHRSSRGNEAHFNPPLPPKTLHLKITSATTGAARLIAFTAEQLAADAGNIVTTMRLRRDCSNLGVISLAHSYGFSNLVLPLLLYGIPLALAASPLPEMVKRAIDDLDHVALPAVPALWRAWHDAGVISPKVQIAISAGAPLPIVLEQSVFKQTGVKIHNFYGSSECGGIAYDSSAKPRRDGACAGFPMHNVGLQIAPNGCLEIRSKAVGETYWPESSDALCGGVFRTSDLAEIQNGFVYLRGRATDQINVAGRKVSPETIERVLLSHPAVDDCLVFGAPSSDIERAEIIVACIVSGATPEQLKQFVLSDLPAWQVPREWWFVDSLQTNQRGKLSRAEWRQKFLERERSRSNHFSPARVNSD